MAKDSKGHGSTKGWGHAEHWEESQRLMKRKNALRAEGKHAEATDMMAKAKEHAEMANHLRKSEQRQAAGVTPKQKMEAASRPGAAPAFWNHYGKAAKSPRNT